MHLSEVEVARAVQMSEDGWTYRQIGNVISVSSSVVPDTCNEGTDSMDSTPGGRQTATTPREDRHLHTLVGRQPSLMARILRSDFQRDNDVRVSIQTVQNRLHDNGLNASWPATWPVLTAAHRVHQVNFAHDHND